MLNFTFIIYGDINQTSGGYYYDRELIKALKTRGHSVRIEEASIIDSRNIQTDIYIIDELCHPDFFRKYDFRKLNHGVPIAAMVHHLAVDEDINNFTKLRHLYMERCFLKRIDFAIFNSISTKDSAFRTGGYKGPFEIAVPGRKEDQAIEKTPSGDPAELVILFLGNIIQRKGLHFIIRHLSKLEDVPFRMIVAGDDRADPAYTLKIKRMILKFSLRENVEILGTVSEKLKDILFRESDLLIMPSSHEGYGIAYLEAMRYGVIPVAGISGGASEFIINGENGYLIKPEDGSQLRAILTSLWQNPVQKMRISKKAVKTWSGHPFWNQSFKFVIDKLEKLCD